eukprot:scaffold319620_cov27-Tisochrysis_lutea.AAC.1
MYALSFVHIEVCMLQGEPRAAFLSFVRHGAATVRAMRCPCIKFCARATKYTPWRCATAQAGLSGAGINHPL